MCCSVSGMPTQRRGPDTIGARTVLAPWWTDRVRDTHRPCTTPNCDGARYVDGLCKRCWHAQIGRNSAADGAGEGFPATLFPASAPVETGRNQAADGAGDGAVSDMNDHPTPAPVDPDGFHCPVCGESWCSGCARPAAPSLPMDLCSDIPEDDR